MSDEKPKVKAPVKRESAETLLLAEFMTIFTGNTHSYGQHEYAFSDAGKEQGTNHTVTSRLVTAKEYQDHLNGVHGLGIIPINEASKCKFGVIDVDVYDTSLAHYLKAIRNNNFPLVPFRSKSGGLHLYLFLKAETDAKKVVEVLRTFTAILGIDIWVKNKLNRLVEVFPKQIKATPEQVGSWINLPYYDAKNTRQGLIVDDNQLSFPDAIQYIKERQRSISEVETFIRDVPYQDGPPCLQTITILNRMDANSGRNNFLFSFGVYLKKKNPEFWEQELYKINAAMLKPLSKDEVETTVIASLRRKEYTFKCLDAPCVDFCRKSICKTREYGIGKEGGYFSELEFGKMYQIRSYEAYYEWEVKAQGAAEYTMLRFHNETDIIKQDMFLQLCFRELHVLPVKLKQTEWFKIVNDSLLTLEIKQVSQDDDTSPMALLKDLFREFILNRAPAINRDNIMTHRVYFDSDKRAYYFRALDLADFIWRIKGFKYYGPADLHGFLRDFGARAIRLRSESGKQLRVVEFTEKHLSELDIRKVAPYEAQLNDNETEF